MQLLPNCLQLFENFAKLKHVDCQIWFKCQQKYWQHLSSMFINACKRKEFIEALHVLLKSSPEKAVLDGSPGRSKRLPAGLRLVDADRRERRVRPAREKTQIIPLALAVANHDQPVSLRHSVSNRKYPYALEPQISKYQN